LIGGTVRRPLWLGLALTLALTLAALNKPVPEPTVVGAVEREPRIRNDEHARSAMTELPATLVRSIPEAAAHDPFFARPQVAAARQVRQASPIPAAPPEAAAAPGIATSVAVPELTHRFLGQMTDPQGQSHLFMAQGDHAVAVQVGMVLKDGYTVREVNETGIELVHAGSQTRALLRRPPPAERLAP
jgi:hypothetical protein